MHCILAGPGDAQCLGLNPRFDEILQKYTDYFGERAMSRINPTKIDPKLEKRDHMHFNGSDATIATLSQMLCDVVRWVCAASVARSEVERVTSNLCSSEVPPARRVPEASPA